MTATKTAHQQFIARKTAAKLLGVSLRTIDRYIKKKLVSVKQSERHVLVNRSQIEDILEKNKLKSLSENMTFDFDSPDEEVQDTTLRSEYNKDSVLLADSEFVDFDFKKDSKDSDVYKDLYYDLRNDIKESQKRLETANYRVGQLETQIKNTIPLLEYTKKERELQKKEQQFEGQQLLLQGEVGKERQLRHVYLTLLTVLLLLQPFLMFLEFLKSLLS